MNSKVEAGDLVKIEYSGKTVDGKEFDYAREKPVLVFAGKGQVIKGLDEALVGTEQGIQKKVLIEKEKAFGERNPDLVRLIPLQRFREQGITPAPGMPLELDGARARVQSVSGGRVRVDFNHELAGFDVEYEFKVLEVFKKPEEKLEALAEDAGMKSVSFKDGVARVFVEAGARKDAEFIAKKLRFIGAALEFVPEVKKVVFEEEYAKQP